MDTSIDTVLIPVICDGTATTDNDIIMNKIYDLLNENKIGIKYDKIFHDYIIIMNIFRTNNKQYLLFPWKDKDNSKFGVEIFYAGLKQILVNGSGRILKNLYIPLIDDKLLPYLKAFSQEYEKRYSYKIIYK